MSAAETCRRLVDTPTVDVVDAAPIASRHPIQLSIGYDLYRAIEELRSVPVLRWPDEVHFDDDWISDVVDRTEGNTVTTNASVSGTVVQSALSSRTTATTTVTVSTISSEWSNTVPADDRHAGRPSTAVDRDLADPCSSLVDQRGWTVNKQMLAGAARQSWSAVKPQGSVSDAGDEVESCEVFVDVATPIDADLLIDDVYERELDELDQLEDNVFAADYPGDWPTVPAESTAVDGFDQRVHQIFSSSADTRTSNGRFTYSTENTAEGSFRPGESAVETHCAEAHPQSFRINTSSAITFRSTASSCVDTSAEELFEEIVESMRDTVSEDDAELQDALAHTETQLSVDDSTTKSGAEKLETAVGHRTFAAEKFADDVAASPVQPPTWPPHYSSRSSHKQDALEEKRQQDLTSCLASTLNECLKALSQLDSTAWQADNTSRYTTSDGFHQKYQTPKSDVIYSRSSAKSSRTSSTADEGRHCVTSSSSGFQSDLMDVDIDEEFDVNATFDSAVDIGAVRPTAESTSLDSLLERNEDEDDDDEEEPYSAETIIRRRIPSPSPRSDNYSTVNAFAEATTISPRTVDTETCDISINRTEDAATTKHDEDGTDKQNGPVVSYEAKSPQIEVLAEEVITQEIVLNIVLPRRPKKSKKRAGADGSVESVESGVIDRSSASDKTPHRDFHIHRVVRCSDAADRSDDRLAISEHPASKGQKNVAESDAVEDSSGANEDQERLNSSSVMMEPDQSLVSRYVGGSLSVELERNAESATTERVDDDTRVHVTRRNRFKMLRAPAGSGAALFGAPVTDVDDVVDDVGRTLGACTQSLPSGVRVTCDAVQRKSSSSLPDDDVTVVRRTIVDDSDGKPSISTT